LRVDVVDHKLGEDLSHRGLGHCAKNKFRSRLSLPLKLCTYLHAVQLHTCNSVTHCLIIYWTSTILVNTLERSGGVRCKPLHDSPTDLMMGVCVEVDVLVTVVTVATVETGMDVIEAFVMVDVVGHILPVM